MKFGNGECSQCGQRHPIGQDCDKPSMFPDFAAQVGETEASRLSDHLQHDHPLEPVSSAPAPLGRADDGWVLVPKEPSSSMLVAGYRAVGRSHYDDGTTKGWGDHARLIYLDMLAAAPSPPVQSGEKQDAARYFMVKSEQLEVRIATLTQSLAEADKVIEPFAEYADTADRNKLGSSGFLDECRAARAWRERNRTGEVKATP